MRARSRRVVVGATLATLGLSALVDIRAYAFMILLVAIGCAYELSRMFAAMRAEPFAPCLYGGIAGYILLAAAGSLERCEGALLGVLVAATAGCVLARARGRADDAHPGDILPRAGATLFGVLYVGKMLAYFLLIRRLSDGVQLSIVLIFSIALTDIFAMLIGRRFGKTPLTRISPGKTVEGALGGGLAAIVGAVALAALFARTGLFAPALDAGLFGRGGMTLLATAPILAATAGLAAWTSIAAQSGDVIESALKRDAGVKDAGTIFAGHGGVLDRFDSYLGGGIAFYAALALFAPTVR